MSDRDHAVAHTTQNVITIGIKTGAQLVVVLRDFLNWWYLSSRDGSQKYHEALKASKGFFFRNEMDLVNRASSRGSDIFREPVSKEERSMIARLCKKEGLDYCLAKRPPDLEKLAEAKYIQGQSLSLQQEKLLNAFLYFDQNGKPLFQTELKGHRVPKLRDDQYLLTIAEKDLPKWDHICTALEVGGKRTIHDITRDIQARNAIEKAYSPKLPDGSRQQDPERSRNTNFNARDLEPVRKLNFGIPKDRTAEEPASDSIVVQITHQDQILIPVKYVKNRLKDRYEIEIPSNSHVLIRNDGKVTTRSIQEVQSYIAAIPQPTQVRQEKTK